MASQYHDLLAKIKEDFAEEHKAYILEIVNTKAAEYAAGLKDLNEKQTDFFSRMMAKAGSPERPDDPRKLGLDAARFVRAVAVGKDDPEKAARWAKETMKDEALAGKILSKALMITGIAESGGLLVPAGDVQELIELLRPMSSVRRAGAVVVPMPVGTLSYPGVASGSTAQYIGENQAQNASTLTLRMISLIWKKLRSLVPLSQELVRMSSPAADAVVRDDLVASLALAEDAAFIRGNGLQANPKGLKYQAAAANVFDSVSADDQSIPTPDETEQDLRKMLEALEGKNVRMINPAFVGPSRAANFLRFIRDVNGNKIFEGMNVPNPTLLDIPFLKSNNIPTNIAGAGADTLSESYLADFADVVIGESSSLEVSVSQEASFLNEAGAVTSAFANDLVVIKAIARHDLGVRHPESICVLNKCLWGAH